MAKGLLALNIEPGCSTTILANNEPGWFIAHFGSIAAGAIPTGIYANNTTEQCHFFAEHCEAVVAFVGDAEFLERMLAIRHRLPRLRAIVMMAGQHEDDKVYSWSELLTLGQGVSNEAYRDRARSLKPASVCELIYTSGTTGSPKAVMLTHDNIVWVAEQVVPIWKNRSRPSTMSSPGSRPSSDSLSCLTTSPSRAVS